MQASVTESVMIFEALAKEYDLWYEKHPLIFEAEARTVESFDLKGFGVEIGVGTGTFARRLSLALGVDPALGMIRIAKRRGVDVVRGFGERLPFADGVFDYALVANTLCFLHNPHASLKEIRRVLKEKGTLVVCEVPSDSLWGKVAMKKAESGHELYSIAKLLTIEELRQIVLAAGFKILDSRGTLSFGPEDTERIECPDRNVEGKGFVCLKARSTAVTGKG
jgi:SAM-dependent methyltransferase